MSDLIERLRAVAVALIKDRPYAARTAKDAADRLTLYETALRTIQEAIPQYLKREMTEKEFALVVLGAVDNKAVGAALNTVPTSTTGASQPADEASISPGQSR